MDRAVYWLRRILSDTHLRALSASAVVSHTDYACIYTRKHTSDAQVLASGTSRTCRLQVAWCPLHPIPVLHV